MEIASQQNFSTIPLTTVPPRRVNSSGPSSNPPLQTEDKEGQQQQKTEQATNQQDARILQRLRSRDREVRAHEAAHAAVGGQYVQGGPSFTFQKGPDGRSYAIGGEVRIDASKVANDPEATLTKADRVRRAALAPAQPSPQDLRIAARANQTAAQARVEIAVLRAEQATQALQDKSDAVAQVADESETGTANLSENAADLSSNENSNPVSSADNLSSIQSFETNEARFISLSLFA